MWGIKKVWWSLYRASDLILTAIVGIHGLRRLSGSYVQVQRRPPRRFLGLVKTKLLCSKKSKCQLEQLYIVLVKKKTAAIDIEKPKKCLPGIAHIE